MNGDLPYKKIVQDCKRMAKELFCFSRREERFVPYTETYKARKWGLFYVIKTRTNYRSEVWNREGSKSLTSSDYFLTCDTLCIFNSFNS